MFTWVVITLSQLLVPSAWAITYFYLVLTDAQMMCDTGHDTGMYAALAFMLLAIAVWSQCACDWGSNDCDSEDEAPEGMFS